MMIDDTNKSRTGKAIKKEWESKVMYGQCIRSIDRHIISEEDTLLWLERGDVKAETESEIIAAQGQALKQGTTQQKYDKEKQALKAVYANNVETIVHMSTCIEKALNFALTYAKI